MHSCQTVKLNSERSVIADPQFGWICKACPGLALIAVVPFGFVIAVICLLIEEIRLDKKLSAYYDQSLGEFQRMELVKRQVIIDPSKPSRNRCIRKAEIRQLGQLFRDHSRFYSFQTVSLCNFLNAAAA